MMPIRLKRRLGTLDHVGFPTLADARGLCNLRSWHILSVLHWARPPQPPHNALPPAVLGVVLGVGPTGVEAVFELEGVDVAPAAFLREVVADVVLMKGGDGPGDGADIPGTAGGQG